MQDAGRVLLTTHWAPPSSAQTDQQLVMLRFVPVRCQFHQCFSRAFLYERPFFLLRFGFDPKISYEKRARKTLLKLTAKERLFQK